MTTRHFLADIVPKSLPQGGAFYLAPSNARHYSQTVLQLRTTQMERELKQGNKGGSDAYFFFSINLRRFYIEQPWSDCVMDGRTKKIILIRRISAFTSFVV